MPFLWQIPCATLQLTFEDVKGQDTPVNFTDSWMDLAERAHLTGRHSEMEFPLCPDRLQTTGCSPISLMIKGWTFESGLTHLTLWAFTCPAIELIVQQVTGLGKVSLPGRIVNHKYLSPTFPVLLRAGSSG